VTRYADLVARFGTPLYVYDLDEVVAARDELFDALPDDCAVYYALKANPHPGIARALREGRRSCRAEISSVGELAAAIEAGFAAADCLYTGPGKTAAEVDRAIGLGVRTFSTDSVTDLRRVGKVATDHGVTVDCLLRVNDPAGAARTGAAGARRAAGAAATRTGVAATGMRMTGPASQFGFDAEDLPAALPALREVDGVHLAGLHFFPLSNADDEASLIGEFQHTLARAADLAGELGLALELLDIGGGFAAPYGVPGTRDGYPKLRTELAAALDMYVPGWRAGRPAIAVESGRYLVACAGTLLLGVTNIKASRGRTFVILDGGINVFGGMSGLGRLLPTAVRPDFGDSVPAGAARTSAGLVGPLCTPGDVLGREVELPGLAPGDVIAVPNTGAYGLTASLPAFLSRPAPLEVVVRGVEVVSVSRLDCRRSYLS
jgi:diaminopimelate decarboxylase